MNAKRFFVNIFRILIVGIAVMLVGSSSAYAANTSQPASFQTGERLVYEIAWSGFIGGEAVIQINGQTTRDGNRVLLISTAARSTGLARALYPVEDTSLSYFDIDNLRSYGADIHITENNYKKHTEITFDHKRGIAIYKVDGGEPQEYPIAPNTNDAFSAIYAFRVLRNQAKIGESVSLPVFDDRKQHDLIIKTIRKEKIMLKNRSVDTLMTTFFLESGGLFQVKGDMTIWFSDDAAFAPIKIKASAPIGEFTMLLKEWSGVNFKIAPFRTQK
ncbi:MAG: DUF3108 domain-containing protein [Patescibacteria group bacterium]